MRATLLFIAFAACSGGGSSAPPHNVVARPRNVAVPLADAAPPPPPPVALGGACTATPGPGTTCGERTRCFPMLPGGYCTAPCGAVGLPCDGACVETSRAGELCMKRCTSDADCRAGEGYTCDPQWHACAVPELAAIVPKQCPAARGAPAVDSSFARSEAWSSATSPGVYQFEPAAALADDGGVVAMYIARGAIFDGNVLGVARVDGKGAAVVDTKLGSTKTSHFDPWLARGHDGTIYAVWYGFDGRDERGEIALASSRDRGATWSAPIAVHEPGDCAGDEPGCLDKPMVATAWDARQQRETIYVLYASGGGLRVRASRDGGKTFAAAVTALAGIYGTVATGGDGRVHVATLNGGPAGGLGSAQQQVEYTATIAGGGTAFAKPVVVSGRDEVLPFFFVNPSVALDDRRKWIYVAYARGGRDAVWDIVIAASKDAGKTWTRTAIGDGCAIHMVPNLAVDPTTGTLHVAWYDSEGAIGRFAHATCPPGAARCTRQGAINSEPFAALSTERHGAKWIGEYASLVVDDKRRVLHAVWAQPVADGDRVVARIFHGRAKLR